MGGNSRSSGAPMRAVWSSTATRTSTRARAPRAAEQRAQRAALDRARSREMAAHIDKAAFTRADMVELVGAQLPVDAPGDPRALIEEIVDAVSVRISAPRDAHHREGHEKFTVDAIIAEEQRVFDMVDDGRQPRAAGCARRRPRRPVGRSGARDPQHRGIAVFGAAAAGARRRGQDALAQGAARRRAPRAQAGAGARADRQGGRRGACRTAPAIAA